MTGSVIAAIRGGDAFRDTTRGKDTAEFERTIASDSGGSEWIGRHSSVARAMRTRSKAANTYLQSYSSGGSNPQTRTVGHVY